MELIVLFIKLLFSLVFLCLGVGWAGGRKEDQAELFGAVLSMTLSVALLLSALGKI